MQDREETKLERLSGLNVGIELALNLVDKRRGTPKFTDVGMHLVKEI